MTSRKKRLLGPGLAWPLSSAELGDALGIDASNYGDGHVVWRFWERAPSKHPVTVTYWGPKMEDLHSGVQITISPVATDDRQQVHAALVDNGLHELAEWISRLATMPEPSLAARPTATWHWDGEALRRLD